jgi:hypothetical protein
MPRESKEKRQERIPLGERSLKLATKHRAGYAPRWVNDVGDRINDFERAGYRFAEDDAVRESAQGDQVAKRIRKVVGTQENGEPMHAYLMEQKQEFYDEDQAAKNAKLDDIDEQLGRGIDQHGSPGDGGRYVPAEGIKMGVTTRPSKG